MAKYDRVTLLRGFVHGEYPDQLFGTERQAACREVAGYLNGLTFDRMHAALVGGAHETRRAAYDNGVAWLRDAYYDYADMYLQTSKGE